MRACCLVVALAIGLAGAAHAQYSLLAGSGGQGQIGNGLPLPIQLATTGGVMMSPIGTMTMFPPLLVPFVAGATLMQAGAAPMKMTIPPGVFKRVPTGIKKLGVVPNNPNVWQVQTRLSFSGPGNFPITKSNPSNTGMFSAGLRTGAKTAVFGGIPKGKSFARYSKSVNQFGGPGQTKLVAVTPARAWINASGKMPPCKHPLYGGTDSHCFAPLVNAAARSKVAAGGPVGYTNTTSGPLAMSPGVVALSITKANGTIAKSMVIAQTAPITNMASSAGFPWTTGRLTLSQTTAAGTPEMFVVTGMDLRTGMGAGTIQLVSGALSFRTTSKENANRGWARYVLPEPTAVLGAGAALAVLGVCHALVRRRSR